MNLKNWLTLTIRTVDFNLVAKQPPLVAKLRELTNSPRSGLNYELNRMLKDANERQVDCKVILAYRFKNLVSWAILSKEDTDFSFANSEQSFKGQDGWLFEVFVSPRHRRQGIASEVYKKARELVGDDVICVCPWDNKSFHFYSKFSYVNQKNI